MNTQEFNALLELLTMMATDLRTVVLFVLLVIAAVIDFRTYRIPNWLTAGGTLFALIYATLNSVSAMSGLLVALGGMAIGFLVMLPTYLLRLMGAGDVKLMAMVGAFLGMYSALQATAFVFVVGGIAAIAFSLFRKNAGRMFSNIKNMTQRLIYIGMAGVKPDITMNKTQSVGKLPYGVCIGVGTILFVVGRQLGFA